MPGLVRARRRQRPRRHHAPRRCATTRPAAGASPARRPGRPAARSAPTSSACSAPTPRPQRHHGLTYFLVPLDTPGVTVRGFGRLDGDEGFAEVFFDDVLRPRRPRARRGATRAGASPWRRPARSAASRCAARAASSRRPRRLVELARPSRSAMATIPRCGTTVVEAYIDAEAYQLQTLPTSPASSTARASAPSRVSPRSGGPSSTSTCTRPRSRLLGPAARARSDERLDEGLPVRARRARSTRAPTRSSATSSPSACSGSRGSRRPCASRSPTTSSRSATRSRELLAKECPPRGRRARRGTNETGRTEAALGRARRDGRRSARSRPESAAGSGSRELDLVLLAEETGRVALPEPFVEHALVARTDRRPTGRRHGHRGARPGRRSCPTPARPTRSLVEDDERLLLVVTRRR